jgi:UDP-N-acetylglucosamine acyltransferase
VLGHVPQDLKWKPVPTYLTVGDGTIVREHVAVHRGTTPGSTTVIGKRCFLICTAHVGHNCTIGDDAIIAGLVAGHVEIGPRVFVSGGVVVHQFVRIGELAMIGGGARIGVDLPPFMTAIERNRVTGPNVVGLRRAGLTSEERFELRQCYTLMYREGLTFPQAVERIAALVKTPAGQRLLAFLQAPSKRGFLAGARHGVKAAQVEE